MAETFKKVWTAQDFRERNDRVEVEAMKEAKKMVENELIPRFINLLDESYTSEFRNIKKIPLIRRNVSMDDYVIKFIEEWAKPFGYEVEATDTEIYLIIPDESETEKYEDS